MQIVFLADLHLSWENPVARTDDVVVEQFIKLQTALNYCNEDTTNRILVIAGDMFDRPRSWYLLPKVIELLKRFPAVRIYTIFGQHDTYLYSETTRKNTNLGILEEARLVTILGDTPTGFSVQQNGQKTLHLYGCHFGQEIPKVLCKDMDFDDNEKSDPCVLIIHAPISNKALFPGHEFTQAKKFLRKHKDFDLVICGDIHRKFSASLNNRIIVNPGPMVRRSAEPYNFKHVPSFGVYDTDQVPYPHIIFYEIPHRPAEEVLSRDHIEQPEENRAVLDAFIAGLKFDPKEKPGYDEKGTFTENLQKYMDANKIPKNVSQIISEVMEKEI